MVENQNPEIVNSMSEKFKISNLAMLPHNVANQIQPVISVEPIQEHIAISASSNTTAAATIMTTAADRDFYLTSASLGITKDAACNMTISYVAATVNGLLVKLIAKPFTINQGNDYFMALSFAPMKIDRNTNIQIIGTFGAGVLVKYATITGYYVDTLIKK